jgi:predicted small secreted protein
MIGRILVAALVLCSFALAGCTNTAKGMGRDVNNNAQATKKAIQGH